jgi:hypothetical protein
MAVEQLKVTSGKQWRKLREEGVMVPLPSGNVVRLRPVGLPELIRGEHVPDLLTPLVAETIWRGEPSPAQISESLEMARGSIELLDLICKAAFLEPKLVDNPQADDEISVDDIDLADKSFVLQFVTAPMVALRSFRDEQTSAVESVRAGGKNGKQAEPAAERPPVEA